MGLLRNLVAGVMAKIDADLARDDALMCPHCDAGSCDQCREDAILLRAS